VTRTTWVEGDFYANSTSIPMQASNSAGIFSIGFRRYPRNRPATHFEAAVAVGGDYRSPDDPHGTAAYAGETFTPWRPAQTPPHGYRSAVAYDPTTKTWITVGPNAPISPATTAATGPRSNPPHKTHPTPTRTGTPSHSPSS
jgi:hypothetical protein